MSWWMKQVCLFCILFLSLAKFVWNHRPKPQKDPQMVCLYYRRHHKTLYRAWFGQTPQNNNDALSSVKRPKWTPVSSTRYNFVIFEGENALMYQVSVKVQYWIKKWRLSNKEINKTHILVFNFSMKMWYCSHLCGFSFCNVSNHINVDSPIKPRGGIISRFNIVDGGWSASWWSITDTESLLMEIC